MSQRIGVTPGAGTLSFAKTLLKVSYSSDQRSRTGIFILIATGGKAFIDPISNKIIASDIDTLIKLHLQQEAPDKRTTLSEYLELLLADKVKAPHQFGGPTLTTLFFLRGNAMAARPLCAPTLVTQKTNGRRTAVRPRRPPRPPAPAA